MKLGCAKNMRNLSDGYIYILKVYATYVVWLDWLRFEGVGYCKLGIK